MEVSIFPYSLKGVKHVVFDSSSGDARSPMAETKPTTNSSLRPQTAVVHKSRDPEIIPFNPQTSTHYELECQIAKIHNFRSMYEDTKKMKASKPKQTSIIKRQKVVR